MVGVVGAHACVNVLNECSTGRCKAAILPLSVVLETGTMNVRQLISEVKQRRPLWDRSHKLRHERSLIEALWDEVAVVMNLPKQKVKVKWKTLKDAYRKEVKKTISDPSYQPHWSYYECLMFLLNQLRIDGASDELSDQNSSNSVLDQDSKIEFVYDDLKLPMENGDEAAGPSTVTKRKYEEDSANMMDSGEFLQASRNETYFDDEDMCFFKSLVPHVKQLPPQKKMLMRLKIQEMIYKEVYSNDFN